MDANEVARTLTDIATDMPRAIKDIATITYAKISEMIQRLIRGSCRFISVMVSIVYVSNIHGSVYGSVALSRCVHDWLDTVLGRCSRQASVHNLHVIEQDES